MYYILYNEANKIWYCLYKAFQNFKATFENKYEWILS